MEMPKTTPISRSILISEQISFPEQIPELVPELILKPIPISLSIPK